MATTGTLLDTALVAGKVTGITGKAGDGATAAGYSAWIKSVTGRDATVLKTPDNRAKLILTQTQAKQMRQWLDEKVVGAMIPKQKPSLEIDMGAVFAPWAAKYAVPVIIIAFIGGYIARGIFR